MSTADAERSGWQQLRRALIVTVCVITGLGFVATALLFNIARGEREHFFKQKLLRTNVPVYLDRRTQPARALRVVSIVGLTGGYLGGASGHLEVRAERGRFAVPEIYALAQRASEPSAAHLAQLPVDLAFTLRNLMLALPHMQSDNPTLEVLRQRLGETLDGMNSSAVAKSLWDATVVASRPAEDLLLPLELDEIRLAIVLQHGRAVGAAYPVGMASYLQPGAEWPGLTSRSKLGGQLDREMNQLLRYSIWDRVLYAFADPPMPLDPADERVLRRWCRAGAAAHGRSD